MINRASETKYTQYLQDLLMPHPQLYAFPRLMSATLLALAIGGGLSVAADLPIGQASAATGILVPDGQRSTLDLAGTWEAHNVAIDLAAPTADGAWQAIEVPHEESNFLSSDDTGPYFPLPDQVLAKDGKSPLTRDKSAALFRRTFTFPGTVGKDRRLLLHCDGIAWRSKIWLNGTLIGSSDLGLAPNVYAATGAIRSGRNEIVIGVAGRAALWDAEHRTFTAPIAGVMPGIYDSVYLESVPLLRIDDVFVKTSVAKKSLAVELTLVNAGGSPQRTTPMVTIRDPDGRACLELSGAPTEVAAGATITVELTADWLAPRLWSPGTPTLYRAETALAGGDRQAVSFGFKEFAAKGTDFQLNGRRQMLLRSSWLTSNGKSADLVQPWVMKDQEYYNCIRQHLAQVNRTLIEQADLTGMMVIPEFWGFYQNGDQQFPISEAARWTPAIAETMRRVIRRYRNHPSVIMWSVTNETFWNSSKPEHLAVADLLVKTMTAMDPTRLLQGDGEVSYEGRLPTINVHYPEGEAGTTSLQYVNSGWVVPNDLDWLHKGGANKSWMAEFTWDRPLMFGEFYARDGDELERYTPYAGDRSYDRTAWSWQDFGGRDDTMPDGNPWIDMVKMTCDHYRAAGVACLGPWTGFGKQTMPRVNVAPLDHFQNAFAGEDCQRRFVMMNDGTISYYNIHLQVGLLIDGREVWADRHVEVNIDLGEQKELTLTIKPPALTSPAKAKLLVRMCYMQGTQPMELARYEEDFFIELHPSLAMVDPQVVALIDNTVGTTAKALASLGLNITPVALDDTILAGKHLLIIGEGAAKGLDLAAAARFAERGGQVLVMHQTTCDPFVPGQPEIDQHHATSFSWHQSASPALAGLDDQQLRWWRPNHLVATESMIRPSAGVAAPLATSGGRYGMHWSPLVEVRHGKGAVTFCQYLLSDRVGVEPAAARMLAQAVRAQAVAAPTEAAPALQVIGVGKKALEVLAACHVQTTTDDASGPVLLDLVNIPDGATITRLRAAVEAGRTVWLRGLSEQTAASVARLLPWKPGFAPLPQGQLGALIRGQHALTAGLGHGDLYWARGDAAKDTTTPLGGPLIVPPTIDTAVLLTEPALLVAVPVGKGWILIDQFAWDQALSVETERATRLVSCLARNAGAGFRAPEDGLRRYTFTGVDLSAKANRGYYDTTAGDGVGGWTDQGDNDMRYFLINHTGMNNGMAVAPELFPAQIKLAGVDWRLVVPKANHDKAVITLRGSGAVDPASPGEVRGIAVGGVRADRVWFLHSAAWPAEGGYGAVVATYEVTYVDGSTAVAPVRFGMEINDWWIPRPMSGAQVAWTGRNAKSTSIGIYSMPWDNPHPETPIASIGVISAQVGTQITVLGITLGVDTGGARPAGAWDVGRFANGKLAASVGGQELTGDGTPAIIGNRSGLRLKDGQHLSGKLPTTPLATGAPLAIEIEVAPDGKPGGYCGGLLEAGSYETSGLRITIGQDLKVCVEIWNGLVHDKTVYIVSREPLPTGRYSAIRFEHDGKEGRLLIDGQIQALKACALPAPYAGDIQLGLASGTNYWFNGVIGNVRITALPKAQ